MQRAENSLDKNPLMPIVLRLLRAQPNGISEYELLKHIEADGAYFSVTTLDTQLALFQKHFLIMNALYRLQEMLWRDEQIWLAISPLRIAIETVNNSSSATAIAAQTDDALRTYYLDWQQFIATDSAAVTELLASFWRRFDAYDQRTEALALLQLPENAGDAEIKQQYRRLAAASHPDRGGDAAQFLAVRAAYELLREI